MDILYIRCPQLTKCCIHIYIYVYTYICNICVSSNVFFPLQCWCELCVYEFYSCVYRYNTAHILLNPCSTYSKFCRRGLNMFFYHWTPDLCSVSHSNSVYNIMQYEIPLQRHQTIVFVKANLLFMNDKLFTTTHSCLLLFANLIYYSMILIVSCLWCVVQNTSYTIQTDGGQCFCLALSFQEDSLQTLITVFWFVVFVITWEMLIVLVP